MKGLFELWIEVERSRGMQKEGIERLNAGCGTKYTESWPSKMASHDFSLERTPTAVRRYMMFQVLPVLIPGKTTEEYKNLVYSLT